MHPCFLIIHVTSLSPIKNAPPVVLFRSSRFPSQSASVNTFSSNFPSLLYHKPNSSVFFRYLRILFTTVICDSLGLEENLATIPTECTISGLVCTTYMSFPIIDMYKVCFTFVVSSSFVNLHLVAIDVPTGLDSSILNIFRTSLMYLDCVMKIPSP